MRLLVVEDEARLARALQRGLTADGFTVDVVGDGVSGLARALEGQYDAVLLDVMLPGLSGYEVVRRLRAEDNWVPVMMVSAKDGPHDQGEYLYFSFVVLTTLGFGNQLPTASFSARFTVIEAMTGQIFLATFVARLVSLYPRRSAPPRPGADSDAAL